MPYDQKGPIMVLNARVKSPDNAVFASSAGHDPARSCFYTIAERWDLEIGSNTTANIFNFFEVFEKIFCCV